MNSANQLNVKIHQFYEMKCEMSAVVVGEGHSCVSSFCEILVCA